MNTNTTKELLIIRHGQTVWNVEGRMQGRLDSPLSEEGKRQAAQHAEVLERLGGVDHILASPSGRTRETAYIINSRMRVPIDYEEVLMERDCGDWSGLTINEIRAQFADAWQARERDPYLHRPPGGENVPDLIARVAPLLAEVDRIPEGRIALVTHGVMSRAILTHYLGLLPGESANVRHPNDLFYRLRFTSDALWPEFFRAGTGPIAGLLRSTPDETILRSSTSD